MRAKAVKHYGQHNLRASSQEELPLDSRTHCLNLWYLAKKWKFEEVIS